MKYLFQTIFFALALLIGTPLTFAAESLELSANGQDGLNSFRGIDYSYSRALDGYQGFNGNKGGHGSNGLSGGNATQAASGYSAGEIQLTIERSAENSQVIKYIAVVNGTPSNGSFTLTENSKIILSANGGNGGNGAPGGSGQSGGNGGDGGDASALSPRSGDGGDGGNGGGAGRSSNGASGGHGGKITLRVPAKDQDLLQIIPLLVSVRGGLGGRASLQRPRPGQRGRGGAPGDNCFYNRENQRQCVSRGFTGINGLDGTPSYDNPINGNDGQDGTYSVEVF